MCSFRRPGGSGTEQASSDAGTPRGIRTPDLLLRRQLLYPAELLAHRELIQGSTGVFIRWSG